MIIPIRCISCSKILADNYREYLKRVRERQNNNRVEYLNTSDGKDEKTIKGQVMDELGVVNMCCRIVYLTHVDIM
jgi:DNA-directed RNA polymerase subunit N (RpoN/RPB10)